MGASVARRRGGPDAPPVPTVVGRAPEVRRGGRDEGDERRKCALLSGYHAPSHDSRAGSRWMQSLEAADFTEAGFPK